MGIHLNKYKIAFTMCCAILFTEQEEHTNGRKCFRAIWTKTAPFHTFCIFATVLRDQSRNITLQEMELFTFHCVGMADQKYKARGFTMYMHA
jgi:hypothetical protein